MPSSIDKEWAVVYGDHILLKEPTKDAIEREARKTRLPNGYEIVALPKSHGTVFL